MSRARDRSLLVLIVVLSTSCGESGGPIDPGGDDAPVASRLTLSAPAVSFTSIGETRTVGVSVFDQFGSPLPNPQVTWTSSDETVAHVSSSGLVSARAEGTARVTARMGIARATVAVSVRQAIAAVTLSGGADTLGALGDSAVFVATAVDAGGAAVSGRIVFWSTGSPAVAIVDGSGVVTAVGNGTATIRAVVDGVEGVASLAVEQRIEALVLTVQPAGAASGLPLTTQPVLELRDARGHLVATDSATQVTAALGSGPGTVGGSPDRTAVGGRVAYTDLAIEGTVGAYVVRFEASALPPVTSDTLHLGAGPPAALGLATLPSETARSGSPLASQPVVRLLDASGNPTDSAAVAVTAEIGSGGGQLSGAVTVSTDASGVAAFVDLAITGVLGPRTLRFTSPGLGAASSDTIEIDRPGAASGLAVVAQPAASATVGDALTSQPAVRLVDASGNFVDSAGVTIAATVASGNGTLGGVTAQPTTTDGVASFTDISILGTLGPYTLGFAAAGLATAVSDTVDLDVPGPAAALMVVAQPSPVVASEAPFAVQPAVRVSDVGGNPVDTAGVVVTATISSGGGSLGGSVTASTGADGIATFVDLVITGPLGPRTLEFSTSALASAASDTVHVTFPGAAASLTIVAQPSDTAASGVTLAAQPALQLRDISGNDVDSALVVVTAAIASGGGSLLGNSTATTDASGRADFTDIAIEGLLGPRTLAFSAPGLPSVTSETIALAYSGAPAQIEVTSEPSATTVSGFAFGEQPVVRILDGGGNPTPASGVTITVSLASGSGTLAGPSDAITDALGVATFTGLSIDGGGNHTLGFGGTGLGSATSDTIAVAPLVVLQDGIPMTGLAADAGEPSYFVFTVVDGAPQVEFVMTGGTGNADLRVRAGEDPSSGPYDCAPQSADNEETCVFATPAAGEWYLLLEPVTPYSGISLTATVTGLCTLNSVPDTDLDRLPDCVETNTGTFVNAFDTGTDPNVADTDGDAITDGDEVLGTLAGLDLPGLGVSPLVPSVLIEYDWFDDAVGGAHTHRPTQAQLDMVTASFAAQGVEVIHDYGQGAAPFDRGNFIADADGNVDGFGSEYYGYKAAHFDANREGYFHYALHPHRYNNGNSSGLAELFGDDMIVATLNFYTIDLAVAGTIQHELGHNMGLHHGGDVSTNRKPNYNSVMNYNYQFFGVDSDCTPPEDGVLDFSYGTRPSLDETNLDESLGICGGAPGWDWNKNGNDTDAPVVADINQYWSGDLDDDLTRDGDGFLDVLSDYDDWGNLYYAGILDIDGDTLPFSRRFEVCPEPPDELMSGGRAP